MEPGILEPGILEPGISVSPQAVPLTPAGAASQSRLALTVGSWFPQKGERCRFSFSSRVCFGSASRHTTNHPGTGQAARLWHFRSRLGRSRLGRSRLGLDLRSLSIDRNYQADLLQSIALCFAGLEQEFRAPRRYFSRREGFSSLSSRFFKLLLLKLFTAVIFDSV